MKDFIAEQITNRYRNHLVIMDNAGSHRNTEVLNEVNKNNRLLYSVPYTPKTNAVEMCFSQIKHYIKEEDTLGFDVLRNVIRRAISKITVQNLARYFWYAYDNKKSKEYNRKKSTRERKTPKYKT